MNPVVLQQVSYSYPLESKPALRNISFEVQAGEFVSIIGSNGSGKSTLCQAIRGLAPKFSGGELTGRVLINGKDVATRTIGDLAKDVGFVFQNPFTQLSGVSPTVFDELAYGLGNLGVPRAEMIERVERMLTLTKLDPLRDRNPFELSGGQQQRVALASILIMEQPILVIDEPTSQLDPETTDAMFELIDSARQQGSTVILVEHKMEQVAELSDRIIVMHDSEIALSGTPAEVFSNPLCEELGVRLPESSYLAKALARQGVELSSPILSVNSLISDLASRYEVRNETDDLPAISSVEVAQPLIKVSDVRFSYPSGVEAIGGVSLEIEAGQSVGIIGQNGAGKTTLAKLLNGLLKPVDGTVSISGEETTKWTAAQTARRVGYVFQNPDDQIFNKTVREEIEYGLLRMGLSPEARQARVSEAMSLTGMTRFRDVNPYDLPASIRKFITIASVLAMDTEIIILDEPTAGQDLTGLNRLIEILRVLQERGKAVITITHDMEFVSFNFSRTIVMAHGRILVDGPTDQVFYDKPTLEEAMVSQPAFVQVADHFSDWRVGLSIAKLAETLNSAPRP